MGREKHLQRKARLMHHGIKTSEVLNLAADAIEQRGWIGTGGQGWEHGVDDPLCIEGAIAAAMGLRMFAHISISAINACPAGNAVRDYLDLGPFESVVTSRCLFEWNDEMRYVDGTLVPQRTAAEVIEVLRAVAVIESARESEAAAVGVTV